MDSFRGDGLNLYAYVSNNPIMYADPSGHCKEKSGKKLKELDMSKLNIKGRTDITGFVFFNFVLGDLYDAELVLVGYDFEENRWITDNEKGLIAALALLPGSANAAKNLGEEVIERVVKKGATEEIIEKVSKEAMEEMIEETSEEVVEKVLKEGMNQLDDIASDIIENGPKWKSDKILQKHVNKRIKKGHIPDNWTATDYNNKIKQVLQSDNLEVYKYTHNEFTGEAFDQAYRIYGDGEWIVMVGENGIMETAFSPDLINGGYSGYLKTLKAIKLK